MKLKRNNQDWKEYRVVIGLVCLMLLSLPAMSATALGDHTVDTNQYTDLNKPHTHDSESLNDPAFHNLRYSSDGSSAEITVQIGDDAYGPGETAVDRVAFHGVSSGETQLTAGDIAARDVESDRYDVTTVSPLALGVEASVSQVVGDSPAQDLNGDGLYRDIDGSGEFNIFDVQTLYNNLDSDAVQENAEKFNFSGGDASEVTIFDVQALFSELQDAGTPSEDEESETLAIHNINVGQSAATLVVGPTGETMLIDTGHFTDDGEHVLAYLQRQNIDRIDYLVTSHNDADHIGGNAAVIEYYETEADGIGAVYDPGIAANTNTYTEYLNAVEEYDVTLFETREGDSIPLENVDVGVLGPPDPYLSSENRNDNSIVLQLEYGQTSFLYTGDAEETQEEYLVDKYGSDLDSTVYKAGHHGSSSSSSKELLDAADPQVAVISSAYDSQYGHPHEEVLQNLADRAIETYWTATHGDVVFVSNGEGVSIRTQEPAPTEPLSLRDGEPVEVGSEAPVSERTQIGAGPDEEPTEEDPESGTGGELSVETIHADAAGDERDNLNDEYIVFENVGDEPLALGDWTVTDEAGKEYTFPNGFTLDAGATVTLRTGSGTDTETDLYWNSGNPVWNNSGDTIIVTDSDGERVLTEEYS